LQRTPKAAPVKKDVLVQAGLLDERGRPRNCPDARERSFRPLDACQLRREAEPLTDRRAVAMAALVVLSAWVGNWWAADVSFGRPKRRVIVTILQQV
jgi:hypothetical protein